MFFNALKFSYIHMTSTNEGVIYISLSNIGVKAFIFVFKFQDKNIPPIKNLYIFFEEHLKFKLTFHS